jgi:hypothetical protein
MTKPKGLDRALSRANLVLVRAYESGRNGVLHVIDSLRFNNSYVYEIQV